LFFVFIGAFILYLFPFRRSWLLERHFFVVLKA
jgi:hypothetical protein